MFTTDQIRSYTDRLGLSTYVDQDGDIHATLRPDEEFAHPVDIVLLIEPNRLSFVAYARDYFPEDIEYKANRTNRRRNFPTAVVYDDEVRMEYSYYISEDVSEEYIFETCVKSTIGSIWSAFVEFDKDEI